MNLFFRLFWTLIVARFRPPVGVLGPVHTPFRVLPTDLDVFMHVNNGVYLSMMDLGRVDLMVRSGLLKKLNARGYYPVVVSQTIDYRRSLKLFDKFDIVTRVLSWDEKEITLEQRFVRNRVEVASAQMRSRFLSRHEKGSVPIAAILEIAGNPPMPTPTGT